MNVFPFEKQKCCSLYNFKLAIMTFSLIIINTFFIFFKRWINFKCGMLNRFDYLYRPVPGRGNVGQMAWTFIFRNVAIMLPPGIYN